LSWDFGVSKVPLKPRHHLLKRLLVNGLGAQSWVEVQLVDALREESSKSPLGNTVRDVSNQLATLIPRQVDVWLSVREGLLLLPVRPPVLSSLQPQELPITFTLDRCSAMAAGQLRELRNARLFYIRAEDPRRV